MIWLAFCFRNVIIKIMSITTILPLLSAVFVIYLGVFVFLKNHKNSLNVLFALFCFSLIFWFFGTFMMFTSKDEPRAIFWDRFVYAGVVFIPSLMYHISLVFSKKKAAKRLLLGYSLSFIFLILSRTDYFVSGLFKYDWGYHTQARFFHNVFLVFFTLYLSFFYYNIYRYYKTAQLAIERLQAKYIFFAYLVLLTGALAYLPAYGINIFPLAYISGLIFAAIFAYTIIKHQLMNIKVVLTEFFVGLIALILFIDAALSETILEQIFGYAMFITFCVFGYLLIKSVSQEIKRREELETLTGKLKRAYEELKKLDKAKSEFISIASHQLRTPLTAIKGYISMLLEKSYGEIPEKVQKPLQNVSLSNERLIKLVNDLLSISRIEAGRIEMKFEPCSMEELVNSVIEELKNVAKEKELYLKFEKPQKPLPQITIDREKIRQVVLNLIDNAIRYTEKGGVTIKAKAKDSKYQIQVSDTGAGLTRYELSKMFESFSRGAAGTRLYTEGVGLGLYIAKKFVEMHQGRIWAESKGKEKGSNFYLELPIK